MPRLCAQGAEPQSHTDIKPLPLYLLLFQVSIPQRYKHKMCGLCGNYNGISKDDFVGRHKTNYSNAIDFANSWRRGLSTCALHPATSNTLPMTSCKSAGSHTFAVIEKRCETLKVYVVSSQCNTIGDISLYYQQCIDKLCACVDPDSCYCQSAKSLLRACQPINDNLNFRHNIISVCN